MKESALKAYLIAKPEAFEDYPFGPDVCVFKVRGRMFALLSSDAGQLQLNLKCDPDEAVQLRDVFPAISPGYHMNKRHWNTLVMDGSIPQGEVKRMIDNSYALVVKGLNKAERNRLEIQYGRDALYGAERS